MDDDQPPIVFDDDFVRSAQFKELGAADRGRSPRRRFPRLARLVPRLRLRNAGRFSHWLPALAFLVIVAFLLHRPVPFLSHDTATSARATPASTPPGEATTTTPQFKLLDAEYRAGDCVTWDQDRQADRNTRVVPCSEPHLVEITGWVDLSRLGDYPTDAEWKTIRRTRECPQQADRYLGYHLDPFGRFEANGIAPTAATWGRGSKGVWCHLLLTPLADDNDPNRHDPFTGRAKGADQTKLWGTGACLALDGQAIDGIVECRAPHALEVVGTVDLGTRWDDLPDEPDAWNQVLPDCNVAAGTYFNGPPPAGVRIDVLPFRPQSWAVGRRTAECVAVRDDPAGQPATLTSPLRAS